MPVSFETGDVLAEPTPRALAHGCNCAGAMGKGIALEFHKRWPRMYQEYRDLCKAGGFGLGDVFVWEDAGIVVFNLGTQRTWRSKAELWAIEKGVETVLQLAVRRSIGEVALPRIGAGLGRLEWSTVRRLLVRLGEETSVNLRVCETFEAGKPLRVKRPSESGDV